MSGLLTGLLTAVAVVATVVSGGTLGIVAGALLAASFAANQGWLGKGAQQFAQSSTGKDLTMAVGLASAGLSIAGQMGANLPGTQAAATSAANTAAEGQTATSAVSDADAASQAATAAPGIAAPNPNAPVYTPAATAQLTTSDGGASICNSFAQDSGLNSVPNSVQLGITGDSIPGTANPYSGEAMTSQPSVQPAANASADQSAVNPGGASGYGSTVTPGTPNPAVPNPTPAQGGPGNMLSTAAGKVSDALSSPSGMLMAGQAISGLAQGKAAEAVAQRQLAAQQWGNIQWTDPNQIAQLNAASAAPITVPQGYLARAAAVRGMMNGTTQQTTPLQTSPSTAATPSVAAPQLATPGAGLAPGQSGSGPVPVAQMNATPRGGVI